MAVRKIIRMGHPTLRKRARELSAHELASPETARLINDMVETDKVGSLFFMCLAILVRIDIQNSNAKPARSA